MRFAGRVAQDRHVVFYFMECEREQIIEISGNEKVCNGVIPSRTGSRLGGALIPRDLDDHTNNLCDVKWLWEVPHFVRDDSWFVLSNLRDAEVFCRAKAAQGLQRRCDLRRRWLAAHTNCHANLSVSGSAGMDGAPCYRAGSGRLSRRDRSGLGL